MFAPPCRFLVAINLVVGSTLLAPPVFAQPGPAPTTVTRGQTKPLPTNPSTESAHRPRNDHRATRAVESAIPQSNDDRYPRSTTQRRREPDDARNVAQQRKELDDLRREDIASQLALLGVPLKWQDHALAELVDWRDRIEAAVTLRVQYRVDVDWRVTSLRDLVDMRLRAAKAFELSSQHGVRVDWRRYSWVALEAMRRQMTRLPPNHSAAAFAANSLATPGSVGRPRRPGVRPRDPDAIIEPTFAFDTPLIWSRPFGRGGKSDPDAILVPRFVTVPSPPHNRD